MVGRKNTVRIEKNILPRIYIYGGLALLFLYFRNINNFVFWNRGGYPITLGILYVGGLLWSSGIQRMKKKMAYTDSFFRWSEADLSGAHRYTGELDNGPDLIETFVQTITEDGFAFAGEIENPCNAVMEVFTRRVGAKEQSVFIIETQKLTMDLLLEHRYLYASFMEKNLGMSLSRWSDEIATVMFVREMSAPLQLLLSAKSIVTPDRGNQPYRLKQPYQAEGAQVVAFVEEEKSLYSMAYKPDLFLEKTSLRFKSHLIDVGYQNAEHVWKGMDWTEILHLKWREWLLHGAQRIESVHGSTKDFSLDMIERLCKDGYQLAGQFPERLGASMDMYVQEQESHHSIVILIDTEIFTPDNFHEHRFYVQKMVDRLIDDEDEKKEKAIRIIICADTMSPALQILLSTYHTIPEIRSTYICAYIQEEKRFYTMHHDRDVFFDKHVPWLKKYVPEWEFGRPETVWNGLEWNEMEGLPYDRKEMIVLVHKALNIWIDPALREEITRQV